MDVPLSLRHPLQLPSRPPEQCKVLVVDDDDLVVQFFTDVLSLDGYQILTAQNGSEALEIVAAENPDVIVLDVLLPVLDGIAVCRHIKEAPETLFVPVILVTGGDSATKLDGLEAHADDFLNKPVDPLELMARVRSVLRTRQLYQQVEENQRHLQKLVDEATQDLRAANTRLEALSQIKSQVLRIVSHELRTPLNRAMLALGIINQEDMPQESKEAAFEMLNQALAVLKHRLDEVEPFSDPTDLKLSPAAVPDLLQGAIAEVQTLQPEGISLVRLDVDANIPPVEVDPEKMKQALVHVIDNAIKFGRGNPVTVSAALEGNGIRISVCDQGIGISQENLPRLLEPLQQGDDSPTRSHGGMGLGLALVKMTLDAHGVELEIDSTPGVGTCVSFVLCCADL